MKQYLELLDHVLTVGKPRDDRTSVGTLSVFGTQTRYDLRDGFPIVTTKKIHWYAVVGELLWFLRGDTNVRSLQGQGIGIWDEWADPETGDLGPIYGHQWRRLAVDQIDTLINGIFDSPTSRRHIIDNWNVSQIDQMRLPPCHVLSQFYVDDGKLSCSMYQRSGDLFLGVPFNIASYALLTHIIAYLTGLEVGEFIHTIGDCHLYQNHIDQARLQLSREPYSLPKLSIECYYDLASAKPKWIDRFLYSEPAFDLIGYEHHPAIKAEVAV